MSHVTGMIDWECAGFRPAWAAAEAAYWLDEDPHKVAYSSHGPLNYVRVDGVPEDSKDALLRAFFRRGVHAQAPDFFTQMMSGVELRSLMRTAESTWASLVITWLVGFSQNSWEKLHKGDFPVDLEAMYDAYKADGGE